MILPSIDEIDVELAHRSLRDFTRLAWHTVEPIAKFIPNWHIDAISDHLEALTRGDILRLVINVPPGSCKSLLTSVFWLPWWWQREPFIRSLHSTYSADLSARDSRRTMLVVKSEWYQRAWGRRFFLTKETESRTENNAGGMRLASSVGGMGTGERVHACVSDDLVRANDSRSEAKLDEAKRHLQAMASRAVPGYLYRELLIMQRLSDADPAGWLLSQDLGYEHLCLPEEFEGSRRCFTSIGFSDPRTKEGELLWPAVLNEAGVASLKVALGPYGYAGQYQQRPAPLGGGRFKQAWFRYFDRHGDLYRLFNADGSIRKVVNVNDCDRFAMMDPAGTDKHQNDKACYTVIGAYDITPDGDLLRFDHYREQVEAPEAAEAGVALAWKHECPWIGVEQDGIGLGVVQTIRRKGVTVRPIKARGSKEARSETAEIRMAAGMIYTPKGAPWVAYWEGELLTFPNGEYKDCVDELAHAAMWVQRMKGAPKDQADHEHAEAQQTAETTQLENEARADKSAAYEARRMAELAYVTGDEDELAFMGEF